MGSKAKVEIKKYLSFPMVLIGSGSFVGVIGWLGVAQPVESLLFFAGSALLSFSGSIATLCGLMSLERTSPNPAKLRKLKFDISKDLKIKYPTFIIKVEKLKQRYQELHGKLPKIRAYFDDFRQEIRSHRSELANLDKQLQAHLKAHAAVIDDDTPDGIAKKILWSERQIQLTELNEALEKLSNFFTGAELERYRVELTYISGGLPQLDQGIRYYRELMILCNRADANYENITKGRQKVDKVDALMVLQEKRLEELGTEMDTKYEEAKVELALFQGWLDDFQIDDA